MPGATNFASQSVLHAGESRGGLLPHSRCRDRAIILAWQFCQGDLRGRPCLLKDTLPKLGGVFAEQLFLRPRAVLINEGLPMFPGGTDRGHDLSANEWRYWEWLFKEESDDMRDSLSTNEKVAGGGSLEVLCTIPYISPSRHRSETAIDRADYAWSWVRRIIYPTSKFQRQDRGRFPWNFFPARVLASTTADRIDSTKH